MNAMELYEETAKIVLESPVYIPIIKRIKAAKKEGHWEIYYEPEDICEPDLYLFHPVNWSPHYRPYYDTPHSLSAIKRDFEALGFETRFSKKEFDNYEKEGYIEKRFFRKDVERTNTVHRRAHMHVGVTISWQKVLSNLLKQRETIRTERVIGNRSRSSSDGGIGLGTAVVGGALLGFFD